MVEVHASAPAHVCLLAVQIRYAKEECAPGHPVMRVWAAAKLPKDENTLKRLTLPPARVTRESRFFLEMGGK